MNLALASTFTGMALLEPDTAAFPNSSARFAPQQYAMPLSVKPQFCRPPATSDTSGGAPAIRTGVDAQGDTPHFSSGACTPICPHRLYPQQNAVPDAVSPQVWMTPASRLEKFRPPITWTGSAD